MSIGGEPAAHKAGAAPWRGPVTAYLYAATATLTVVGALSGVVLLNSIAAGALALFITLEFRFVPRAQQVASGLLLAVAITLAVQNGLLVEAVAQGLRRTLPFVLIFASVTWLQAAARESPSVMSLRRRLTELGQGHRFVAMCTASHLLGSGFNLAGVALLAPMFESEPATEQTGMRMRTAVLWGFASATCWSPLFVGTAAVLSSISEVRWIEALPYGLVFGAYLMCAAMLYDHLVRREPLPTGRDSADISTEFKGPVARLLLALLILFSLTGCLIEFGGLSLTVSIALVAPTYAVAWLWLVYGTAEKKEIAGVAASVFRGLPRMRSETTIFACANVFGVVMAKLAASDFGALSAMGVSGGPLFAKVLLLMLGYMGVSAIGVHPLVSLVVFVSVVDPTQVGLPTPLLVATLMALWGVGTSVSPFSGTTLFMAQLSGTSSFRIAWVWDAPFYLVAVIGLAALVTLMA